MFLRFWLCNGTHVSRKFARGFGCVPTRRCKTKYAKRGERRGYKLTCGRHFNESNIDLCTYNPELNFLPFICTTGSHAQLVAREREATGKKAASSPRCLFASDFITANFTVARPPNNKSFYVCAHGNMIIFSYSKKRRRAVQTLRHIAKAAAGALEPLHSADVMVHNRARRLRERHSASVSLFASLAKFNKRHEYP